MQTITKEKLYLLVKLLKEKRVQVDDDKQKHNLIIMANAFDQLIRIGIDRMIDKTKLEVNKNAGK